MVHSVHNTGAREVREVDAGLDGGILMSLYLRASAVAAAQPAATPSRCLPGLERRCSLGMFSWATTAPAARPAPEYYVECRAGQCGQKCERCLTVFGIVIGSHILLVLQKVPSEGS